MMNRKKFFTFFIHFFVKEKRRAEEGARTYMKNIYELTFQVVHFLRMEIFSKFLLRKPLTGNEKGIQLKVYLFLWCLKF